MVGRAEQTGDERQPDDDVQPLLHDFTIDARQPNQQVGEQRSLDHLPDAFHPQVNRPPPVKDGDGVVVEFEERRQIQDGGHGQARHQDAFGRREPFGLPDRHPQVIEEHQHHDDDREFDRQRLFQQLVAGRPPEQHHDGCDPGERPQAEPPMRHLRAVKLCPRFSGTSQ